MKFTIEISEESLSEDNFVGAIAYAIADKILPYAEKDKLHKEGKKKVDEWVEEVKKNFTKQLSEWDKSDIIFNLEKNMENTWKSQVAKKVADQLKVDYQFTSAVAKEIIKSQFKSETK